MNQLTIQRLITIADGSKSYLGYTLADSICCFLWYFHEADMQITYEFDPDNSYRDLLVFSPIGSESTKVFIPAPLLMSEDAMHLQRTHSRFFQMRERGVHNRKHLSFSDYKEKRFWKNFFLCCNPNDVITALMKVRPRGYEDCVLEIEAMQKKVFRYNGELPDMFSYQHKERLERVL